VEEAYTFNEERREGTIALLNIGERITNLNIVEKGTSRFTRDIFVGAKNYTQSIAQELGISIDEARHLKESLKTKEDPYMQKLSFPLEQVHNLLVNEINRSFTYYSTQLRRESVGCMFIAGGGSKLVGLKEVFSKNLGIPVRHLNPFLRLHNATSYTMEELEEMAPLYAVSVGLALRGLA
jgi:type IV pilus assembly protein PilM